MIQWNVILWCCITLGVLVGIFGMILSIISAVNMKKRRKEIGGIHTTLAVGSKILFAGGFVGKVVRMNNEDEIIGVEIAPKTIVEISRFAVQQILE